MRIHLLAVLLCLQVAGWGQTNISGVVNTYYRITNISASEVFTLDNVNGLNAFDKVVIIQMKGASVKTNVTDATYGSIINLNKAGDYEVATICKVDGSNNTVTLANKLLNTNGYDVSAKVQMVKIARYETAIVNNQLLAGDWVNSTGKGGVLAIMANELILYAPVSADGKGYKGGDFDSSSGEYCRDNFAPNYNYDPTPTTYNGYSDIQLGAYKGESIVDLNINHQGGKGAIATGGGGGNNHNTAGGGGSNIGAGGMGGNNTSQQVNFFKPACYSDHPGVGGYALSYDPNRLFMGGGGGAGHGNNTRDTSGGGGNGGGIIFIIASSLRSNGYTISANGGTGLAALGDGASGGGGGGSIVLNVSNFPDAPIVSANGGNGGAVDNENIAKRCYGEGGGGGGGAIYFSGAQQGSISVQGGLKGARLLSNLYCTQPNMARDGNNGAVYTNYTYGQSSTLSTSCPEAAFLPVELLYFKVANKGSLVTAEWKVENPEDGFQYILQRKTGNDFWKDIHIIAAEERTHTYQKADGPLVTGIYMYRLKIVEKDRSVSYSPIQQISIKAEDLNRLLIHPNPTTSQITIITPSQTDGWLNIYDMKSRLVYRKKVAATDAVIKQDISFLAEGVYMIQLGRFTARFVVFK